MRANSINVFADKGAEKVIDMVSFPSILHQLGDGQIFRWPQRGAFHMR